MALTLILVLLVLPAWAVDAEDERGVEGEGDMRGIMRQRYWAGNRHHGREAVGRTEEGSSSEGDKNEKDLVDGVKNTITVEHKNDIQKSWQRRKRVRIRRLNDGTSVTTKQFAGEIKGELLLGNVGQGLNSAVKERKERIKKRRRKKMRKFPETTTPYQKYTQRNTNKDKKSASNEDRAAEEIIKLNTSQKEAVNRFHVRNAINGSESEEMGDINQHDPLVITVKDYDKNSIKQVLENKEQTVGDVLLVNGRPAIVKKRRTQPKQILKQIDDDEIPQKESNRKLFGRKLLKSRKIVRVKVRAKLRATMDKMEEKGKAPHAADIVANRKDNKQLVLNSFEDLNCLTSKARNTASTNLQLAPHFSLPVFGPSIRLSPAYSPSSPQQNPPAPRPSQPFPRHPASNINLQTGAFTLTTHG